MQQTNWQWTNIKESTLNYDWLVVYFIYKNNLIVFSNIFLDETNERYVCESVHLIYGKFLLTKKKEER